MQEIKRVLTGFISSLMIISFILMPIPQTNRAWAADSSNEDCVENPDAADNGLYKAGCKLDDAHTQAKMDTIYGSDDEKWIGYFQQAVFGMMSVVFLDNLFLKYLYAKDPKTYGNDCPENTAAKLTIRGAQLAALAYIIGEVQANIKYKEEAKAATDLNFAAKDKTYIPSEDSEEVKEYKEKLARGEDAGVDPRLQALKDNNAQEDAYDALIKVLEAQAEAIKTKIRLTTTAEIALLAVEAGELLNIKKCKARCTETYKLVEGLYKEVSPNKDTADSSMQDILDYSKEVKTAGGTPQSCIDLKNLIVQSEQEVSKAYNIAEQDGVTTTVNIEKKHEKKKGKFFGIFNGLSSIFNKSKSEDIENSDAGNMQIYQKQQDEDEQDEVNEANENSQSIASSSTDFSTITGDFSDYVGKCERELNDLITDANNNYTDAFNDYNTAVQEEETAKTEYDTASAAEDSALSNKETALKTKLSACSGPQAATVLCTEAKTAYEAADKAHEIAEENEKIAKDNYELKKKETKKAEEHKDKMENENNYAQKIKWDSAKSDVDTYVASFIKSMYSRTECCGLAGITTTDAQKLLQSGATNFYNDASTVNFNKTTDNVQGGQGESNEMPLVDFLKEHLSTYNGGGKVDKDSVGGTFVHQGLTEDSVMSKRKDITPFNPLKKKSSGIFNRNKDGFNIEFVLPILIENELYAFANKHYIDWNSHNPFLIQDQFKEVKQGIDGAIIKLKKHIHTTLNPAGPVQISFEDKIQTLQNGIRTILSKVTFISKAHAIDVSGAGMAIGGMALNMLASELGGPWAEVLNVGSKYLMLKGILNMLGMTELFLKPKSRSLTWAALLVLAAAIIIFDTKALEKVENHIAVVKAEKNRYLNSAAARTGLNADNKVSGNQSVKLEKYDPQASQTANMNVKACVVAKGNALAPGMCPSVIPKQRVSLPELSKRLSGRISADHLKNISMTTDALYGASNGSDMGAASLSDSKMDEINKTKNALKRLTASLRKEMEEDDKASAKRRGVKVNLGGGAGSFKKVFGSSVGGPSGGALSSGTLGASYNPKTGNSAFSSSAYKKNLKKKTGSSSSTAKGTTGGSDLDLDFGDDDMSSANGGVVSSSASKKKHSQDLRDYEVGMNDINQRKEVPIWKIISNRYILSYPKILEEDKK